MTLLWQPSDARATTFVALPTATCISTTGAGTPSCSEDLCSPNASSWRQPEPRTATRSPGWTRLQRKGAQPTSARVREGREGREGSTRVRVPVPGYYGACGHEAGAPTTPSRDRRNRHRAVSAYCHRRRPSPLQLLPDRAVGRLPPSRSGPRRLEGVRSPGPSQRDLVVAAGRIWRIQPDSRRHGFHSGCRRAGHAGLDADARRVASPRPARREDGHRLRLRLHSHHRLTPIGPPGPRVPSQGAWDRPCLTTAGFDGTTRWRPSGPDPYPGSASSSSRIRPRNSSSRERRAVTSRTTAAM